MISMSVAFHLLKMTPLVGSVWSCVSLVRGWWLCRPMGCDFNWIPAFSSRPQVKPVVLVFPDLGFFSSQPPPVHSSPLFHSLICCSACAPGFPLLPWLPYRPLNLCSGVVLWQVGAIKSQNSPYLIFRPSDSLQSRHRPLILSSSLPPFSAILRSLCSHAFIYLFPNRGLARTRSSCVKPVCNESDSTDTGKLILEVRL